MKYAKIESNKVAQVQPSPEDGFVEIPDNVVCGMIKETDGTFVNPPIPQEQLDAQRIGEIDARLKEIDVESVRPLRAINAGTDTQFDRDKLADLDAEAETLRTERAGLV